MIEIKSSKKKTWIWVLVGLGGFALLLNGAFRILDFYRGAAPLPPRGNVDPALLVLDDSAPAPLAVIDFSQTCLQMGEPFTVSGQGSADPQGLPLHFAIDFGDGTVLDGVEAEHAYTATGAYRVTLTATNSDGAADVSAGILSVGSPSFDPGTLNEIAFQPNFYDPRIIEEIETPAGGMVWGFFNAQADATVTNILVNGLDWEDPSSGVVWCEVVPGEFKAGEIGILRCMSNEKTWTDGAPISLQVETDAGTAWAHQGTLQAEPLAISYVAGRPDGSELLVYARNDGEDPVDVTGLLLNGQDVSEFALVDESPLRAGRTTTIRIPTCGGITWGERLVVTVLFTQGETTQPHRVTRELRLFPSQFMVGNWNNEDVFTDPTWRQTQRDAGINLFIWYPSASTPPELVLPMAEAEDFYVFTHVGNPSPEYIDAAKNWGDHPRWYMNAISGEPDIGNEKPTDVLQYTQTQMDLFGPTKRMWIYAACSYQFGKWGSMADIGGMDHYTVWAPKCNVNWPYLPEIFGVEIFEWWDHIEFAGYYTLAAKRAAEPRPIIIWTQGLFNGFQIGDKTMRCNTPAEIRSQWYQNLGWGAKVMLYYHFLQEHDPICPEEPEQEMGLLVRETDQFSDLIGIGEMTGNTAFAWSYDDQVDVVTTISPDGLVLVVSNLDYDLNLIAPYRWHEKTNVEIFVDPPEGFEPYAAWSPEGEEAIELQMVRTVGGFYKITIPSLPVARAVIIEPEP